MKNGCIILAGMLAMVFSLHAQVVINEYSCANKSQHADATGNYEDWIELYNAGASPVNIGGWYLSDQKGQPTKWQIPAGVTLAAGGRRMFYCSARDGLISGQYHTNFKLTQSSGTEEIILANGSGTIVDSVTIIPHRRNHSRGRATDGSPNWRVFETPTPNATNNTQTAFIDYVPKVVFSLQAGFYTGTQTLTLSCPMPNTTIYYTTNGAVPTNTPSATNLQYTGPITISSTRPIRARAFDNSGQYAGSFTVTNTYFINEPVNTYPVWSVVSNNMGSFFSNGNETMVSIEYFASNNGPRIFQQEGDIRRHGNDSWAYSQKGFRYYSRDVYGYANKMDYQIFPTTQRTDFDVVLIKAAGSDNFPDGGSNPPNRCAHTRDAYVQTLSEKFNLNVDVRRFKNAITYVNGQYWGIYESRERVDEDYTEYYYDNGEKWVDMLKYWGGLDIEAGSDTAWNNLFNFIINNSMTNPANYAYVQQRLDFMSLIDYIVLNTYTVNSDWLNWNTAWWRGRKPGKEVKWRYNLWDQDNTFNLGQNYTGISNTTATASPCDVQSNSTYANTNNPHIGHIRIFNRLMQNQQFRQLYINRYADLVNTAFYCPNMLNHFDTMIARLAPEMQRHTQRWGSSVAQWNNAVTFTRNQIAQRCNNVITGLGPCYNVTGPYNVKVNVYPPCAGKVKVNTTIPDDYPFSGVYYGGINVSFKALPATGWVFSHWQLAHTPQPNTTADSIWFDLGNSGDSIVAVFVQQNPTPGNLYVLIQGNNPGVVTVNGNPVQNGQTYTFNLGSQLNINAQPNPNCTFSKWTLKHALIYPTDTTENARFCFTQPDTLVAIFDNCAIDTDYLTVIVQQPGWGSVTINNIPVPAPVTLPIPKNTLLNLQATPSVGYNFQAWQMSHHNVSPSNNQPIGSFTIIQDDTLYVIFKPDTITLTILVNPGGGGDVALNGNTPPAYPAVWKFPYNTQVNLLATPATGFNFVNYTLLYHTLTPNNTTPAANFTITKNDTLTANFALIPPDTFNLTVIVSPPSSGNVSLNGNTPGSYPTTLKFVSGTNINLSATAQAGYSFQQYTLKHHTLVPNNTTPNASFTITQHDTLIANFVALPDTHYLVVVMYNPGNGSIVLNGVNYTTFPQKLYFAEGTNITATQTPNPGYLFSNWHLVYGTLSPINTASTIQFTHLQDDTLYAYYIPEPPDTFAIVVNIKPHVLAGKVTVGGFTPPTYPYTMLVTEGTNIDFEASGNTLNTSTGIKTYTFDRYEFMHHQPFPNPNSPIVFITAQVPDTVIAYFNESNLSTDTTIQILAPTGFTPDGDGVNDIFRIFTKPDGTFFQTFHLQIYNRWGQKVFESNNQSYGWNGEFNEKKCDIGVYTYTLTGKLTNGEEVRKKGNITLLR
ncbi:MAG: CotH kinase family protein [Chitinophagales bacterium]|nr:CotH kinase family protein [Chitinophagales bacterium]